MHNESPFDAVIDTLEAIRMTINQSEPGYSLAIAAHYLFMEMKPTIMDDVIFVQTHTNVQHIAFLSTCTQLAICLCLESRRLASLGYTLFQQCKEVAPYVSEEIVRSIQGLKYKLRETAARNCIEHGITLLEVGNAKGAADCAQRAIDIQQFNLSDAILVQIKAKQALKAMSLS